MNGDVKTSDEGERGLGSKNSPLAAPSPSLPKGGGAIRGIGEKFAANPVTGTGSLIAPIAISPGRSGFGPGLAVTYDSGSGNGPFGMGWSMKLPQVARKTDKGLPQYDDIGESDVFILSGLEDLMPAMLEAGGQWSVDTFDRTFNAVTYRIKRYRPRIEGLFARIERWTALQTGEIHWRSISKENVTTWFGTTAESRIADPADPARIFAWLICQSSDAKGNVIAYGYKSEDSTGIPLDAANEQNRTTQGRSAQRYLKSVHYGNRTPFFPSYDPKLPATALPAEDDWMFKVILDYGDCDLAAPSPGDSLSWPVRDDPFSTYRPGFEVRTYRLCRRALMFNNFPAETGVGPDCLVRSTDFSYVYEQAPADPRNPVYSLLASCTQTGYVVQPAGGYLSKSLPPVEFAYSEAVIQSELRELDPSSRENLPAGIDGSRFRWIDLDGEGLSGVLSEQSEGWFYKRNLSPVNWVPDAGSGHIEARFGAVEQVAARPALALADRARFVSLAGDGRPELVQLHAPAPGFYKRTVDEQWEPFTAFLSLPPLDWEDPNLRFVDIDGDGLADVLVTEDNVFTWYRSLGDEGFDFGRRVTQSWDEEKGPAVVFADGTQSVYLADMSGDGLTDIVRIRNGEVCYWPNIGYGRFGPKVAMDHAPYFDLPERFDQRRLRLADIGGSGAADILYLHPDGVRAYFNQSGNAWSEPTIIPQLPAVDNLSDMQVFDLLGTGTACLVWSSPLPADSGRPLRYLDLMGGQKPHLLTQVVNNLGAETAITYAPSTKFYVQDRLDGRPWATKLPFPVHVVERVESFDRVSRNRFVTRHAYHHGYFDGAEREFRGFGMVEHWDTEEFSALNESDDFPTGDNVEAASHVPPVHTKTWFHTGALVGRDDLSDFFAGLIGEQGSGEYYREPGASPQQAEALILPDNALPTGLSAEEQIEASRALKGTILRQEIYALDGTPQTAAPYSVSERNHVVERLQPRGGNPYAVFFTRPSEVLDYHYERNPADPRISHALTLEVGSFGEVLKSAAVGYGRRQPDAELPLQADQDRQTTPLLTYVENDFTNATISSDTAYLGPLNSEARHYELTGYSPTGPAGRFQISDLVQETSNGLALIFDQEINFESLPTHGKQSRLFKRARTYYRPDDLGVSQNDPETLLPLGTAEPLCQTGESYTLALTPGLLTQVFQGAQNGQPPSNLLPSPSAVLPADIAGGLTADRGGYVDLDSDGHWWIPSGRTFRSPVTTDDAPTELGYAQAHFFLALRYRDPFGQTTTVAFDAYDLLVADTRDPLGNRVTAGERDATGAIVTPGNDYRVLQPKLVMDPNRNRAAAAFDAQGLLVGTAVMGKPSPDETLGDTLDGFAADLEDTVIQAHLADPLSDPYSILQFATTRLVYDLFAYQRTQQSASPQPAVVYTLARETHHADLVAAGQPESATKVQHAFSYSDGFGREIQKKLQAEPGPVPQRDPNTGAILLSGGQPVMTVGDSAARWVGSGWTIFNNKGKPVRKYEPFFTHTPQFEFDVRIGVSSVLFYDPVERLVGTLHPNQTWEKVIFGPWRQETWDVNDTVLIEDTEDDADLGAFFLRLPDTDYKPTWWNQRQNAALGALEQEAAAKVAIHGGTPTLAHFDTLGRAFLTIVQNRFIYSNAPSGASPTEESYCTRVTLDIQGNRREARDAVVQNGDGQGRVVMRYDYDMADNHIHQASMEAGERWLLHDVAGKSVRTWDSRGHAGRIEFDPLRRPVRSFVVGADPNNPSQELLVERSVYGEQHPQGLQLNLMGAIFLHFDQAGLATHMACDFKGNVLGASRQVMKVYQQAADWRSIYATLPTSPTTPVDLTALAAALIPLMEGDIYSSSTAYDALNRPTALTSPDNSVVRPAYNEANLLEQIDVNLHGAQTGGKPVWTPFVTKIDYDPKGRRTQIDFGNGAGTTYQYDQLTFRLSLLLTQRNSTTFSGDDPQPPPAGWPGSAIQNLSYTYDPAGNITHIEDQAQQTIFFRNQRVEPSADYTYDATYRLIEAKGREHLGQTGNTPNAATPSDAYDSSFVQLPDAGDGAAMGTYLERYLYDSVGNILALQHRGANPANPGWSRAYSYAEASQLEAGKTSNRLSSTAIGPAIENCGYVGSPGLHGDITSMAHLSRMQWDYRDQLQATAQTVNNAGTPETTWYVYDSTGQRVRKVTERQAASGQQTVRAQERIYLGSFEIYREYAQDGVTPTLERDALHVMDDKQRVALVETLARGDTGSTAPLIRYQFGNHIGSACLELDDQAQIISYEEYFPYGSTAYQATPNQTAAARRYRYTGKERDEENGFYYHGARYFAPWLGRWTQCDPAPSENLYPYVQNNPIIFFDPNGREESSGSNRFFGGLRALGGLAQMVVGGIVFAQVEVPVAAQALGGIAIAHGASDWHTGWKQVISGQNEKSPIETTTSAAAQKFGMQKEKADALGAGLDTALGFVNPAGPTTGMPRLAMALATTGERTVVLVNDASKVPQAISTTSNILHAMSGGTHMAAVAKENPSGDRPAGSKSSSAQPSEAPTKSSAPASSENAPAHGEPSPAAGAKSGGAKLGKATSKDYRATFFAEHPELKKEVVVHHAIEQQALKRYSGVVNEAEIHSLENLRGIPKSVNSDIHLSKMRVEWNQFYRANPNATKEQLLQKVMEIDAKYGSQFKPPR